MAEKKYEAKSRAYMYSPDCPQGKIFDGADAIAAAEKNGWVDSPDKLPRTSVKSSGGTVKATRNDNRS